jgi:hypothetical protein
VSLDQWAEAFAATIDTAAWVVLILIFELQTSVFRGWKIKGVLRWTFHGITAVCYALIVYSLWGYVAKLYTLFGYAPVELLDICSLVGENASIAVDLDEYVPLDASNCVALANADLYQLDVRSIYAEQSSMSLQLWLAWVDVINAIAWVGVVIVLEADVWLQQREMLTERFTAFSRLSKVLLYGTLVAAAVYWAFAGDFVDFWDALLWLLAFIFIEMNFFEWQKELARSDESSAAI